MQIATYCATPPALVGEAAGDVEVVAAAGLLGVAVELVTGALVVVEPLVVEVLLLPQPASSAAQSSATTNGEDRLTAILLPLWLRGRSLAALTPTGDRLTTKPISVHGWGLGKIDAHSAEADDNR